jgi:hypothetical protein
MTIRSLFPTVLALACASALTAQTPLPIAYPQNGTDGSSGQIVPLGFSSSSTNFDEGRWQQVIPERYLPSGGGAIFGLDVLSQATNTPTYASLQISFSLSPAGTPLSSSFAANMPAPVVVYTRANTAIAWTARQWQTLTLDQVFVYPGAGDLVVDIQKVFDRAATGSAGLGHHQTTSNPGRTDLPRTAYAFGALGSGAANAATATNATGPMKMRLQFVGAPTMLLTATRGGANQKIFAIGHNFESSLQGQPGSAFGALISLGWFPAPASIPGLAGSIWIDLSSATAYASGILGPTGTQAVTWNIPNDPGLVGASLTFQGVAQGGTGPLVVTNATDLLIND